MNVKLAHAIAQLHIQLDLWNYAVACWEADISCLDAKERQAAAELMGDIQMQLKLVLTLAEQEGLDPADVAAIKYLMDTYSAERVPGRGGVYGLH